MISLIAAISENNIIGNNGTLPWHLPRDFKHFKETTLGHPVVMGRKTYESIGRPLPGRENIVLTRQEISIEGVKTCKNPEEVIESYKDQEIFIIGGGEIYTLFLPHADKIYLTRVHTEAEGDALFPTLDNTWQLMSSEKYEKDKKNKFDMTSEMYERRK